MTFPRVNGASWGVQDPLTSPQMNELDINVTQTVDATQGGSYLLGSSTRGDGTFEFDFSGVPDAGQTATFRMVMADDLPGLEILSTLNTPGTTGLVIDVSLGTDGDILRRGLVVTGGDSGNAIVGTGGATVASSTGLAGAGLEGIGGDNSGGTTSAQGGGIGVIGIGGTTDSAAVAALGGIGGFFTGGDSAGGNRNGGIGISVSSGQPTGTGSESSAILATNVSDLFPTILTSNTDGIVVQATSGADSSAAIRGVNTSSTAALGAYGAEIQSVQAPALHLIQTDLTPLDPQIEMTPTASPGSSQIGGVYFSNVAGEQRLGFWDDDVGTYQTVAIQEEGASAIMNLKGDSVSANPINVASEGLAFTLSYPTTESVLITWATPLTNGNYIISVTPSGNAGGVPGVWEVAQVTTLGFTLVRYDFAGSFQTLDTLLWAAYVQVYGTL